MGNVMTVGDTRLRECDLRRSASPHVRERRWIVAGCLAAGAIALCPATAHAQAAPWKPQSPQYIQCPAPGQPLIQIPEIIAQAGKPAGRLRGTILLNNGVQRLYLGANDPTQCLPQDVR